MSNQVDQFGRDRSNLFMTNSNEDKSKKILDSLAEIKYQLKNKDYKPNFDFNTNSQNQVTNTLKKNLNLNEFYKKIESLEKRIDELNNQIQFKNNKVKSNIYNTEEEQSIFNNFIDENYTDIGKSLLVLKQQNKDLNNFKFYHFILFLIVILVVLVLLVSHKLKLSILEVVNIFL